MEDACSHLSWLDVATHLVLILQHVVAAVAGLGAGWRRSMLRAAFRGAAGRDTTTRDASGYLREILSIASVSNVAASDASESSVGSAASVDRKC